MTTQMGMAENTNWIHSRQWKCLVPKIICYLVIPSKAPILPSNQDKKCDPGLAVASPQLSPCQQSSPHDDDGGTDTDAEDTADADTADDD